MHGCTQLGRAISQAANANRRDGSPTAGSFTCTPRGQAGQRVGTHGRTGRRPALPYSEPRVMSPARMSTFIYMSRKHGTGRGRRQPEGQSQPGSQPPPPPTPREEGRECPFSERPFFSVTRKGVKEIEAQGRWNHTPRLSFQFAREPFARGPVTLRAHVTLFAGVWSLGGQTPVFGEGRVARCGAFPSGLCPFANGVGPGTAPDSASLSLPLCKTGMITRPYMTELLKELLHVEHLA